MNCPITQPKYTVWMSYKRSSKKWTLLKNSWQSTPSPVDSEPKWSIGWSKFCHRTRCPKTPFSNPFTTWISILRNLAANTKPANFIWLESLACSWPPNTKRFMASNWTLSLTRLPTGNCRNKTSLKNREISWKHSCFSWKNQHSTNWLSISYVTSLNYSDSMNMNISKSLKEYLDRVVLYLSKMTAHHYELLQQFDYKSIAVGCIYVGLKTLEQVERSFVPEDQLKALA